MENAALAPYAVKSAASRGRQFREKEHPYRTRFQRDRDRIVHSSAFRRLEYKTQVFVYHEGDYYRTRLTHSLEVSQIARSISKALRLNEDLAEAVALAHDLGHPPFGHNGQDVLNRLMKPYGGFEHNRQSLRIVKCLEKRYPDFDGLNLTWEVLEGISKRLRDPENPLIKMPGYQRPPLEAQVVDYSDSIAYNAHDLDDGVTSNLLDINSLGRLALWRDAEKIIKKQYANLDDKLKKYQAVRNIINTLATDLIKTTSSRLKRMGIQSADEARSCKKQLASFSSEVEEKNKELKKFLYNNMYRHRRVQRMEFKADLHLTKIFEAYMKSPKLLPEPALKAERHGPLERRICDYISGMTDRYAIEEYKKLYMPDEKD
ncbi:MAG: deoxyguanosinetriphosphate triphosphohydrolase [Candidatus Nitrohelix vancouverensis]|uniref:Deoxyguanosinetriphosphate triphosphohydrolase-like protein n=1 Tax=Candidatus Nitrohelix vancouverensis TaxID=2705534 RepID=A0A7T0C5D5_9BACT|nr:MAG: deoxyguanosinetriphosphate triphosphohydrolase [Candidatus Nitrohelix vancouverensis]